MHLYSLFSLRVCGLFRFFFLCFGYLPVLVCLSIDVTGALVLFGFLNSPPPFCLVWLFGWFWCFCLFWWIVGVSVRRRARIPTRGLDHPPFHSSSLFSLSLRHSLLLPTVPLYLLCLNMLKLNRQQLMDSMSSESKQP